MKVCKFGGTSLADAVQITKVANIVLADPSRRVVVVSAPGKRSKDDVKVTDMLIACARRRIEGGDGKEEARAVVVRFEQICQDLNLDKKVAADIGRDLDLRMRADPAHEGRFMDSLKAAGEDYSARVMAALLRSRGQDAHYVNPGEAGMLLSDEYGNAQLLPDSYGRLASLKETPGIVVFPGFFGYTLDGHVVTFPRGGSDITGTILAVALKAEVYENFTDVDSVFAINPAIVPGAQPIPELTYREMRELAYAGFSVLHEEAIVPAVRAGIPICIKNTQRPELPGTRIVAHRDPVHGKVVGIASDEGFCTLFLDKYLMNREIGFGRRLLQVLEEEGLSYEHVPSGIDNMSVILREKSFKPEIEKHVLTRIKRELDVDDVEVERGLALIMIVGEGMRYTVGLAAKATKALGDAGVNIEMMNQGSSEISMMFGVKAPDRIKAVRALYQAFFD